MDDILEKLVRHRNVLVSVFLFVLGAFLAALFLSGDVSVIAQALGNVVGAAIGAVGAAGAVVWQMRTQDRKREIELNELRRTAFADTLNEIFDRIFFAKFAAHSIVHGNIRAAVRAFADNPLGRFVVDPELASQLKIGAPADIPAQQAVKNEYVRLWQLAVRVQRASEDEQENGKYFLAHGIVAFTRAVDDFLIGRCLVEAERIFMIVATREVREELKPITDLAPEAGYRWASWGVKSQLVTPTAIED